ncbi:MAG: type II toxin-antitoxin system HipA family toxin [Sphingobacteriales bacterium]|nr:MAG: type II toxin-antitoxin system HipA family toxin [Sphingobacteriales bacterium]
MTKLEIRYCPSTLRPGFTTYSPGAQLSLFGSRSKKISHLLPFGPPGKTPQLTHEFNEKRKTISISGVQEKYSLLLEKNELMLTSTAGTHIIKPVPFERLERIEDMPANEHVTMQIARQLFKIKTADCGMIFFNDNAPAYITKRFDYKPDGTKYQVEDFATLLGKSPEIEGNDFKYNASYIDIARLILKYVPAAKVELINFFRIVVFNYLFSNGDAHLKNFSLMESSQGDYLLAPAYDLLCTSLHIADADLALHGGLYNGDIDEQTFTEYGFYTGRSLLMFAGKMELPLVIAEKIINESMKLIIPATEMINRSFLSAGAREKYQEIIKDRYRRLQIL